MNRASKQGINNHRNHVMIKNEDVKTIGLFESKEDALKAVDTLYLQSGFKDHAKVLDEYGDASGLFIEKHEVGRINWTEGFITNVYK